MVSVTVTARAARFVRLMTRMQGAPAAAGLRLQLRPGGCAGLDASFDVVSAPLSGDTVLEHDGARLFLPATSRALLHGYTIDYVEGRLEGGLRFIRPDGMVSCDPGSCAGKSAANTATAGARTIPLRPAPSATGRG